MEAARRRCNSGGQSSLKGNRLLKLFLVIMACVGVLFAPGPLPVQCRPSAPHGMRRMPMASSGGMAAMPCCRCGAATSRCTPPMNCAAKTVSLLAGPGSHPCPNCRLVNHGRHKLAVFPAIPCVRIPRLRQAMAFLAGGQCPMMAGVPARHPPDFRRDTPQSRRTILII